jgi:3-oxoadipate enol-lactonase
LPTLAFANSLGTDFRIWDDVRKALAGQFNLLFYDKRGHGLSTLGAAPHRIEDYAADLAALLDHLQLKQVVAVGLSVGGLIVQGLYHTRPDLVAKLVISNSAVKIGTQESWNARIAAVQANGIGSIADNIMKVWYSPAFHARAPEQVALSRAMLARTDLAGYVACCEALREVDYTAKAASIKVPTLFLGGVSDGSTPPALVEAASKFVPGAKFHLLQDCAHIPCVEQPLEMARLLKEFVLGQQITRA